MVGTRIEDVYGEIRAEEDPTCTLGANIDHLQHLFEGYRSYLIEGREVDCPYDKGSAKEISWSKGRSWAQRDLAHGEPRHND